MSTWVLVSRWTCVLKTVKFRALTHYLNRNPYPGSILPAGGCQGLGPIREWPSGHGKLNPRHVIVPDG